MVALAKKLHRYPIYGKRRSLNDVAEELAKGGYMSSTGKPFARIAISRMLERKLEAE
ncbi:hypothetical protein [Rhizobium johnstonii]|uniref:hypothetical protein n=1 Tax=Rhizobium johnstonii TaxID=3019933 RepID=UPI003F993B14